MTVLIMHRTTQQYYDWQSVGSNTSQHYSVNHQSPAEYTSNSGDCSRRISATLYEELHDTRVLGRPFFHGAILGVYLVRVHYW